MTFKTKCSRCGYCCLVERCPVSKELYGPSDETCPALDFEQDLAICKLAVTDEGKKFLGIGEGCCIQSSISYKGAWFDFSCQLPETKKNVVMLTKSGKLPIIKRRKSAA